VRADSSEDQTLAALVDAVCERHASRPALFFDDHALSYAELAGLVAGWTARLHKMGIGPGDCVALWLPNCPAFVVSFLAALRVGAIAAPLGALLTAREVTPRLAVARADALVTTSTLASQLTALSAPVLTVDPRSPAPGVTETRRALARAADDLAVLISTSGTTGTAKAAELTHGGITWNASALADGFSMGPRDVQLAVAPLSHVLGMTGVMSASLLRGGALALMDRFDAAAALRLMRDVGVTGIFGAPSMFLALVREAHQSANSHTLRFAMTGGAATAPELASAFEETFGCSLRDGYGMSEVGGGVTLAPPGTVAKPRSVGPAFPGSELRAVDLTTGAPLPAGARGEIAVRSPSVMRGYRGDEQATRAVLDRDGWLLSGDVGYLDEDGYLFLVDRKKELIIRSGYNVYPREVEDVLLAHPGVREAAVVGLPHDQHGEEVVALVVPAYEPLDVEVLKSFARERLAAYKYPRHIFLVGELVKGPTGKVVKRAIDVAKLVSLCARDERR